MLEFYIREKKQKYIAIHGLFKLAIEEEGRIIYSTFKNICYNIDSHLEET